MPTANKPQPIHLSLGLLPLQSIIINIFLVFEIFLCVEIRRSLKLSLLSLKDDLTFATEKTHLISHIDSKYCVWLIDNAQYFSINNIITKWCQYMGQRSCFQRKRLEIDLNNYSLLFTIIASIWNLYKWNKLCISPFQKMNHLISINECTGHRISKSKILENLIKTHIIYEFELKSLDCIQLAVSQSWSLFQWTVATCCSWIFQFRVKLFVLG